MQVVARAEAREGAAACTLISLSGTHDLLKPGGEHGTQGGAFLSGKNTRLAQQPGVDFQRDICFHASTILVQHDFSA